MATLKFKDINGNWETPKGSVVVGTVPTVKQNLTLYADEWYWNDFEQRYAQEVSVLIDTLKRNIIDIDISPSPIGEKTNLEEWARCNVMPLSERSNRILFICDENNIPTRDLHFSLTSMEVQYI